MNLEPSFFQKKYFFHSVLSSNYPIGINYQSGTSASLKAVILAGLNSTV